jgi:glycosyltransferase involved in cell wall biosynthesis
MTVYNDFRFLDEAVESILRQDFADIELVLVDDGNHNDELFGTIARRDARIRVVSNSTNLGAAVAANRGIDVARSDIIVRLDADDVAEPTRVGRLVKTLNDDPSLGLVGSTVTCINEAGEPLGVWPAPESDAEIRWTLLFYNPFHHSAAAYRKSVFERAGRYRPSELISQDHYLWFDMLPFCKARNLQQPLTRYRLNHQGLALTNITNARSRTHAIREVLWRKLGIEYCLYDDEFAFGVNNWVKGGALPPEKRAAAYRVILPALRAFVRSSAPRNQQDFDELRWLAAVSIGRMLRDRPVTSSELFETLAGCWTVSPVRTARSSVRQLINRWL